MNMNEIQTQKIANCLGLKETAKFLGVSLPTLWRLRHEDPTFPKIRNITSKKGVFLIKELETWLDQRIETAETSL